MDEKVRELLEKAKLTAGLAADTAVKAAGVVTQKSNLLVEKTKQNFKVFDLNNEVELLMREIGRMVYLTHTGVETDEQELEAKLAQIDEKYAKIEEIRGLLEEQSNAAGIHLDEMLEKLLGKDVLPVRVAPQEESVPVAKEETAPSAEITPAVRLVKQRATRKAERHSSWPDWL